MGAKSSVYTKVPAPVVNIGNIGQYGTKLTPLLKSHKWLKIPKSAGILAKTIARILVETTPIQPVF